MSQPIGAHGFSISTSAGYNFDLKNGWFIEPSAGFIYSKTSVDNFTNPGTAAVGKSLRLWTARWARPLSTACWIYFVNTPWPPMTRGQSGCPR